jgi:hypothetical protein
VVQPGEIYIVWSSRVPQVESEYLRTHGERLPAGWLTALGELAVVRRQSPLPDSPRCIVFPACEDVLASLPAPPALPADDVWQVLVTTIQSVAAVTVRLLGDSSAGRLDTLLGDMDLHYFQDPGPAPAPELGRVYAAQAASEWHRVRVEQVGEGDCLCLFVDHGDRDRVALGDLRELRPQFLLLPAQALAVAVAGLEDFLHREAVLPSLNQLLLGKSLVARVEDRAGLQPRLVFFDTSRQEDLNINQRLIELIVSADSKSRLPGVGAEPVRVLVRAVTDTGQLLVTKVAGAAPQEEAIQEPEGDLLTSLPEETGDDARALACRLAGVPPEGHAWSKQATLALRELVGEEEVVSLRVVALARDGCPEVELHLEDGSHGSINFDLSTELDIFPPCTASLEPSLPPSPSGPASLGGLPPLPPASQPAHGSRLDLRVTHAVSPDSFVVRLMGEERDPAAAMDEFYRNAEEASGPTASECHEALAAGEKFFAVQQAGGQWQRVEVTQAVGGGPGGQAVVRLVDEGGKAVVGVGDLRPLPERFRSLPCQVRSPPACLKHGRLRPSRPPWPGCGPRPGSGLRRTTSGSTSACPAGSWRAAWRRPGPGGRASFSSSRSPAGPPCTTAWSRCGTEHCTNFKVRSSGHGAVTHAFHRRGGPCFSDLA